MALIADNLPPIWSVEARSSIELTGRGRRIVHLPRSLIALFPGTPRRVEGQRCDGRRGHRRPRRQVPGIGIRVLDAGPSIRAHLNVFVAGERADARDARPGRRGRPHHPGGLGRLIVSHTAPDEPVAARRRQGTGRLSIMVAATAMTPAVCEEGAI